jgi:hypothetical protein
MAVIESTTASTAATVGLAALLAGAFGQVAADVMMVVLASIAGVVIALSGQKSTPPGQALKFFLGAALTSLVLAWSVASVLAKAYSGFDSAYTPTILAFMIGTQAASLHELPAKVKSIISDLFARLMKKNVE